MIDSKGGAQIECSIYTELINAKNKSVKKVNTCTHTHTHTHTHPHTHTHTHIPFHSYTYRTIS